jgi:cytochrome P450
MSQEAEVWRMTMEAGSDTTASTLLTFVLALINYPRVLKEAQREVDLVTNGQIRGGSCGGDNGNMM